MGKCIIINIVGTFITKVTLDEHLISAVTSSIHLTFARI